MSRTRISIFEDDGIATLHKDKTGIHRYILWEFTIFYDILCCFGATLIPNNIPSSPCRHHPTHHQSVWAGLNSVAARLGWFSPGSGIMTHPKWLSFIWSKPVNSWNGRNNLWVSNWLKIIWYHAIDFRIGQEESQSNWFWCWHALTYISTVSIVSIIALKIVQKFNCGVTVGNPQLPMPPRKKPGITRFWAAPCLDELGLQLHIARNWGPVAFCPQKVSQRISVISYIMLVIFTAQLGVIYLKHS